MKKFFSALFVVLFATSMMAQTGLTCEDPIPVGTNYEGSVEGPCTVWYTANTYDLPLHVFFVPDNPNSKFSPEVYVDFTCEPGVYDDPKLDSLINKAAIFGLDLPIEFMCSEVVYQGKKAWDLPISNSYRETLAKEGITYNLSAVVQVKFFESGQITMTPDTVFSSCLEHSRYVELGDTLEILPNDSNTTFVFPYTDWKNDSVRYVWLGEDVARVWLATDNCDFKPVTTNAFVWSYYDLVQDTPHKLQKDDIKEAINAAQSGGIFFGKVLAPKGGKLVVEKIPVTPPAGGAILLEYDQPVSVTANSNQIFAYPKTWLKATMFEPNSIVELQAEFSNTHRFVDSIGLYVNTHPAETYDTYAVHLTSLDMAANVQLPKDKYVYVRFTSPENLIITPRLWSVSPCIDKSRSIMANEIFYLSSSSSVYYRLNYEEYSGYDLTINWAGTTRVSVYFGDTCSFTNSASDAHVLHNKAISKKSSYTIPAATIDSWANRVDADGFLYVNFSNVKGNITFQTEKPAPVISPCVLASTLLEPTANLTLSLDNAFDVYRIDYQAWLTSGVKLVWTGAEPLHTFVAQDCEFAVAIHHKDVVNYTEVPAKGEVVLDKDILSGLSAYVDEDGYLYVRFLTEYEGQLTTALAE